MQLSLCANSSCSLALVLLHERWCARCCRNKRIPAYQQHPPASGVHRGNLSPALSILPTDQPHCSLPQSGCSSAAPRRGGRHLGGLPGAWWAAPLTPGRGGTCNSGPPHVVWDSLGLACRRNKLGIRRPSSHRREGGTRHGFWVYASAKPAGSGLLHCHLV